MTHEMILQRNILSRTDWVDEYPFNKRNYCAATTVPRTFTGFKSINSDIDVRTRSYKIIILLIAIGVENGEQLMKCISLNGTGLTAGNYNRREQFPKSSFMLIIINLTAG